MSGPLILVDGDNLLWRLTAWRAAMAADAEAARTSLERRLARHRRVRVVCDGPRAAGRSADDLLVARVRALAGRAIVVTDDRHLQMRVRALGARCQDVRSFALQYLSGSAQAPEAEDRGGPADDQERDAWCRIFS